MPLRQSMKMVLPTLSRKAGFPMTSPTRPYYSLNRSSSSSRSRWHRSRWHRSRWPAMLRRNLPDDFLGYVRLVLMGGLGYMITTNYLEAMKIFREVDRKHDEEDKRKQEAQEQEEKNKQAVIGSPNEQ